MPKSETALIEELLLSVEALGVEGTTCALRIARNKSMSLEDKRIEFVLNMISTYYNIPIEEIINSHTKSTKRMLALKFSIYYLYDIFDISFGDLKQVFKRHKSLLSRSAKEMRNMISTNEHISKLNNRFDIMITDFKLKNNF
jgi:hypothetical protein